LSKLKSGRPQTLCMWLGLTMHVGNPKETKLKQFQFRFGNGKPQT
jgi:hypothetical protein